jgi:T3SS (YopN, CesT) and YbjN peptide-binding chaperone 1
MQFTDPTQETAYRHVAGVLTQLYGESARPDVRAPLFWIAYGSAEVGIHVESLPGDRVYVRIFSWVVTGPRVDEQLMRFLLDANRGMRLGAFGIDAAGDVEFAYGLADHELSPTALRSALVAVMQTADDFGDMITERFGGMRWVDRARAAQPPADFDRALEDAGLRVPPMDETEGS